MAELSAELCDLYVQLIHPRIAPGGVSPDLPEGQSCDVLSELLLCCRGGRRCSGFFCFVTAKCRCRNSGTSGKYWINSVCVYLGTMVDTQKEGLS